MNQWHVAIVGGGFGGIRTALDLTARSRNVHVTLVSDKTHFEYHPALYKIVTGTSPLEVCIPLIDIFKKTDVDVVYDSVLSVDIPQKVVIGSSGSKYHYDFCVHWLFFRFGFRSTRPLRS